LFLTLLFHCCGREPAPTVFQPTLNAAEQVARQRYGGDLIVFISDSSAVCRRTRSQVFGPTPLGRFIAANFAAVEVPAGSTTAREILTRYHAPDRQPQIIVAADRLNNLRIHVVGLERLKEQRFLSQLQAIKQAKTIDDFRRAVPYRGSAARGTGTS
jgi:hypothetical protein